MLSTGAETMSEADLGKRLTLDSPYQEFRRLTQAFNSVMDRFQRSGEIQRSFCDIAAHEMKTPLTILQGNLEVALLKARTSEEYREALINNLEQVGRLIALTRSLLTLAKFTSGKPPVHLVPLALEPMIQDLVDELTLLADDRRITLSFESQSVPPILGDAQWLKQALINLLDNALHYTPSGGAVTVRLQAVGEGVAVAVEDTGHGIEPEHLPHLFERFYRTDWARAKDAGGTGLGLPIVKEIAEAHGGTISVTSQVDKGSVFTLRLPVPLTRRFLLRSLPDYRRSTTANDRIVVLGLTQSFTSSREYASGFPDLRPCICLCLLPPRDEGIPGQTPRSPGHRSSSPSFIGLRTRSAPIGSRQVRLQPQRSVPRQFRMMKNFS